MLWLAYVAAALLAAAALRQRRPLGRATRTGLALGAVAVGGVGMLLLASAATEPGHAADGRWEAYLLLAALVIGAAAFAGGVIAHGQQAAEWLRIGGWSLMVMPLLVPSTLTLALPVVAVLAIGIRATEAPAPAGPTAAAQR
jgi:hypothetical protein